MVPAASTNYELSDGQNKITIKTGEDYVIPVETKPSTTYTLSDGKQNISTTTSDHTDLDELVAGLREESAYKDLEFTIYADNDGDTIKLVYKQGIEPTERATLKTTNGDVFAAEDATTHDDMVGLIRNATGYGKLDFTVQLNESEDQLQLIYKDKYAEGGQATITAEGQCAVQETIDEGEVKLLDRTTEVRKLDSESREAVEQLLRRMGVAPRATMSVAEAAQLAESERLIDLGKLKVEVTDVKSFGALDGSNSDDSLATTVVILPGTSVADASLARDAARLLLTGTDELTTLMAGLTAEDNAVKAAEATGSTEPVSTPITDDVRAALTQTLFDQNVIEDVIETGIEAGQQDDLVIWLDGFAKAIAILEPENLSSQSVLESVNSVISQVENITGSKYGDTLIGDNQNNVLRGLSGNDIMIGGRGRDTLHGGTGGDRLYGDEGSDVLEGGGGADLLEGGTGDDLYSLLTPTLTLKEAFQAMGGDPDSLQPIERDGELISWEKFRLWADPTRWQGEVQGDKYEELGFIPDQVLYKRSAADESVGWLLHGQGGTVIRDSGGLTGSEDELRLQLPSTLSLDGPQDGAIGMARGNGSGRSGNNDLIIDINADGILNTNDDLTIENYFYGDGTGQGSIGAIRQYGLNATYYYGDNFEVKYLNRVDSNIDFDWGYYLPDGNLSEATSGLSARWTGEIVPDEQGDYRFRVTTDSGRADSWELFVDNEKITSEDELLSLKAERAVDVELRWMDSADNKVHYLPVTAKASTEYVLTDGISSIKATTSDQTNLNELVNALKQVDGYESLLFTIQSNASSGRIELTYKNEAPQEPATTLTAAGDSPIQATYEQNAGDHSVSLEWAQANKPFEIIDVANLRTGTTITAMDILGSNDLLIPVLDRELYTGITRNWEGNTQWGDIDNDGDLDLLVYSYDEMGNGESQILINEIDDNGDHHFTSSFDLPAFERVHSAEWGDWNNDGFLDLIVAGIRTNEEFQREETVELLLNRSGIDFYVATPENWETKSSNVEYVRG